MLALFFESKNARKSIYDVNENAPPHGRPGVVREARAGRANELDDATVGAAVPPPQNHELSAVGSAVMVSVRLPVRPV